MEAGVGLHECLIIEVFAGTGRVTAALKQLGLVSSFGTDHIRSKHAVAPLVLADLSTESGVELLMQWLSNPRVVGIFLAPPCGSASRARSIPLKRRRPGDPAPPKPLRSNQYPNGLPFLCFVDRLKISKANKLYHLTAKLIRWAVETDCIFCVENPQFSFFWQTSFIQEVIALMRFTVFQSCQYGSTRPKRTMLGFNAEEFHCLNKMCTGVTNSHKHDQWGLSGPMRQFATAMETAYPTRLAKTIALQFVLALQRRGILMPPETLAEISQFDAAFLPSLRAQTGLQAKASKLPPLIPVYAAKVALTAFRTDLPQVEVGYKTSSALHVDTSNAPTTLPKGSKLLCISTAMLPSKCLQRGAFVSGQQLQQCEIEKIVQQTGEPLTCKTGVTETQVWGVPWSERQFIEQMVKFGHPMNLQSNLPDILRETVEVYNSMDAQQRMAYRADKLGFWLRRLLDLKNDEAALKQSLDSEVARVLEKKNILLWRDMLRAVKYNDMEVVDEFMNGSQLVGCVDKTGLWPAKFQPAAIGVDELHQVASKERALFQQNFGQGNQEQYLDEVWKKTMEEVETGALVGPFDLCEIPDRFPLSRRFGISQGEKVRCIDDYSRSSVNSTVQTCESPKPHTLDVYAALCVLVMSSAATSKKWLGRTFDLTGAYRQCAVHPDSKPYAHIAVRHPVSKEIQDACTSFRHRSISPRLFEGVGKFVVFAG